MATKKIPQAPLAPIVTVSNCTFEAGFKPNVDFCQSITALAEAATANAKAIEAIANSIQTSKPYIDTMLRVEAPNS